ncbi:MAG: helix-turn-helix transcriptional regulator [Desulfobulbaceae bacterium]|nr:helix-turn-helix transcriptional regulator [Desulfobulbaceae bacterium]
MTELRTKIKEMGMHQRFIADAIGMKENRFSDLVAGRLAPTPEQKKEIARVMRVNPSDIWPKR